MTAYDGHQPRCKRFCAQCSSTERERAAFVKFLRDQATDEELGLSVTSRNLALLWADQAERGEHHRVADPPTTDDLVDRHLDKEGAYKALEVVFRHGGHDGEHHKQWVLDQVLRALTGDNYEKAVAEWCDGEDGPETYDWDEGIPP